MIWNWSYSLSSYTIHIIKFEPHSFPLARGNQCGSNSIHERKFSVKKIHFNSWWDVSLTHGTSTLIFIKIYCLQQTTTEWKRPFPTRILDLVLRFKQLFYNSTSALSHIVLSQFVFEWSGKIASPRIFLKIKVVKTQKP